VTAPSRRQGAHTVGRVFFLRLIGFGLGANVVEATRDVGVN